MTVALGGIALGPALAGAAGLAGAHVLWQSLRQSRHSRALIRDLYQGDFARALQQAEEAYRYSQIGPLRVIAAVNLASLLHHLKRLDDARELLRRHQSRWPHHRLARMLWQMTSAELKLAAFARDDISRDLHLANANEARHLIDEAEKLWEDLEDNAQAKDETHEILGYALALLRAKQVLVLREPSLAHSYLDSLDRFQRALIQPHRINEALLLRCEAYLQDEQTERARVTLLSIDKRRLTPRQREIVAGQEALLFAQTS